MPEKSLMMQPEHDVGIAGYGAYIPRYRLPATEVARIWKGGSGGTPIREKAVAGLDEDVITMSVEAARNALARAQIDPTLIRAVWVGSESHPYAVKPTSTIVAEAIGATPSTQAADWEFACKAGTEAVQAAIGMVGSGMAQYALAIGMDTAQGRPWRCGLHPWTGGRIARHHRGYLFLFDRYARFLATGGREIPGAWRALYRRTCLFQTHQRRGA